MSKSKIQAEGIEGRIYTDTWQIPGTLQVLRRDDRFKVTGGPKRGRKPYNPLLGVFLFRNAYTERRARSYRTYINAVDTELAAYTIFVAGPPYKSTVDPDITHHPYAVKRAAKKRIRKAK